MRVFVVRPFGTKTDSNGKAIDFDRTHRELIAPALHELGWSGDTTVEIIDTGNIRDDMFRLLVEADVVIADITIHNANVFYELGIRHALRKRATFLLRGGPVADKDVFDLLTDRYLWYPVEDPASKKADLVAGLRATSLSDRPTDSPVHALVPELAEANFVDLQVVPVSLREEIQRARAARSRGWLRLLADDVKGMRFELAALRLIGAAQWGVTDYEAALATWRRVLDRYPNDVPANLAVSNLYERLSRTTPSLLLQSDQALDRVLGQKGLSTADLAEAHALRARNLKTRWRAELAGCADLAARRRHACSSLLRDALEEYLAAFRADLNAYYPGLAALQLATILLEVSQDESWYDHFDTDDDAEAYIEKLDERVTNLQGAVALALEAAPESDTWAASSRADYLFLTQDKPRRIARAYERSITSAFQYRAVEGQLVLFRDLGVRDALAGEVLTALKPIAVEPEKPQHLVVFVGHMTDRPERTPPRLPPDALDPLSQRLKEKLAEIVGADEEVVALASGCPGSDLAFHECCRDREVPAFLCLPMPSDRFAANVFGADDAARSAYLQLTRETAGEEPRVQVLELSDQDSGLPRWLETSGRNPWERGNRWTLRMAESWGAPRVSLIAVWDEQDSENPGGTAAFVKMARASAQFEIHIVPPVI